MDPIVADCRKRGADEEPSPPVEVSAGPLATLADAVAGVRSLELWRVPDRELLDYARAVELAVRALAGVAVRVAGEVADRGTAATLGARSSAALLREASTITAGQARGRVRLALACLPSETPTGHSVEPALPDLLAALDAGRVSEEQAVLIADTLTRLPAAVDAQTRVLCRDLLLDEAGHGDVIRLRRVVIQIRAILDPDGSLDAGDPVDRQEVHIGQRRRDGLTPIRGLLDPLNTEALRQVIEPLAHPRPLDDKTPDPRPAAARRAHALGEALARYLAGGKGPIDGGVRPQVVVTVPLERLLDGLGTGWADYTGPIDAAMVRMLACDARLIPQVLSSDSVVLDQGRAVRLFPPEIRRAIATRDRGCSFPACDIPAAWCDAHHIRWWERDFGRTSERNGALLCRHHHTVIHRGGWEIRMSAAGRPEYLPPPYVDPLRTPRANQHWVLSDLAPAGDLRRRAVGGGGLAAPATVSA